MDCFNHLCPFRQNTTSSCNRCECLSCQNRCKGPVKYTVRNQTLTADEIAKITNNPDYGVERLAAYEDTGLMPEEIVKMGMMFEDSKRYSGRLELKLMPYLNIGLSPDELKALMLASAGKCVAEIKAFDGVAIDRLCDLDEADKDGRLVVLPCKVGQRVFALMDTDKHISECEVKQIGMGNEIGFIRLEPIGARGREYGVALNGFGKTVFLTREEAEKALEAMKNGN